MINNTSNENKSFLYALFGLFILAKQKALGRDNEEMARGIKKPAQKGTLEGEITKKDIEFYKEITSGRRLANDYELRKLSDLLDIPLAELTDKRLRAKRKAGTIEAHEITGAFTLSYDLEKSWENFKKNYEEETGRELTSAQRSIFGVIKAEVYYKVLFPSPLPFDVIIILDALKKFEKTAKYLHEIPNFMLKGENFAGYSARHTWAGYLFYMANLLFFEDDPSPSFLHCTNRLEISQTKEILALGFFDSKIYKVIKELPILQKMGDFTSFSTMFAREFRIFLPRNINPDYLEMAVTLQGCGQHILYTCLQPSLWTGDSKEFAMTDEDESEDLSQEFFAKLIYDLHPDLSAMYGSKYRCSWDVIDALQNHHNSPETVTPLCAWLKLINYFADKIDLPLSQDQIKSYMADLPQIDLGYLNPVFEVFQSMQEIKNLFIEKSSSMVAVAKQESASRINEKLKNAGRSPILTPRDVPHQDTTDPRFSSAFQQALCDPALDYADNLMKDAMTPRLKEKWNDFLERLELFHLRRLYSKRRDFTSLAHDMGLSESTARRILKINK